MKSARLFRGTDNTEKNENSKSSIVKATGERVLIIPEVMGAIRYQGEGRIKSGTANGATKRPHGGPCRTLTR